MVEKIAETLAFELCDVDIEGIFTMTRTNLTQFSDDIESSAQASHGDRTLVVLVLSLIPRFVT